MVEQDIAFDISFRNLIVGRRVTHPIYGLGYVVAIEDSIKMGDNNNWDKSYQSSITRVTNGASRYTGHLNVAVKFDNGGPMGFAVNASNEAQEIESHVLIAQAV